MVQLVPTKAVLHALIHLSWKPSDVYCTCGTGILSSEVFLSTCTVFEIPDNKHAQAAEQLLLGALNQRFKLPVIVSLSSEVCTDIYYCVPIRMF